jgi:predicted phosphoribosyltransferase
VDTLNVWHIEAVAAKEQQELNRRARLYRGDRAPPDPRCKTVILVDDGLATGATMLAAAKALRQQQAGRIIVAVSIDRDSCSARTA